MFTKRHRHDSGSALLEFAIMAPIVIVMLVFGIVVSAWYFFLSESVQSGAAGATRQALVAFSVSNAEDQWLATTTQCASDQKLSVANVVDKKGSTIYDMLVRDLPQIPIDATTTTIDGHSAKVPTSTHPLCLESGGWNGTAPNNTLVFTQRPGNGDATVKLIINAECNAPVATPEGQRCPGGTYNGDVTVTVTYTSAPLGIRVFGPAKMTFTGSATLAVSGLTNDGGVSGIAGG